MKTRVISCIAGLVASCAGLLNPTASQAADLLTTNVQASGQNWTASIWRTNNGAGVPGATAVAPVANNTYQCIFNGLAIGNGLNSTRIRNPAAAGIQTFPGDSLTLNTNSELRAKTAGAILNFPGVGGNPGLFLRGGMLNGGDDTTFALTGRVQVVSGTLSYISHGANGGGGGIAANRGYNFTGLLSGSGDIAIMNSGTTVAQQVNNSANTFNGSWIVQCGWLLGGLNFSLGTNSITVDPSWTGYLAAMPAATSPAGPAVFEVNYNLNSAGRLTLVNGGQMKLHQNCYFSAVIIEGTPLSAGFHSYADLNATYPANFPAGGSGSITVRPYSDVLPTLISTQPRSQSLYAGRTARFSVVASGTPPFTYQWLSNNVAMTDSGGITGTKTNVLLIPSISAGSAATYSVQVNAGGGSTVSSNAVLTLATPTGTSFETAVLAANPVAYYQLNETSDPSTNNTTAFDYAGGLDGSYGPATQNGFPAGGNIAGPRPADSLTGFASDNHAASFAPQADSRISLLPWNLNTNTVTLLAWINPGNAQFTSTAIAFCRGGGTTAGLVYSAGTDPGGNHFLGYNWNGDGATTGWNSGIAPTPGQWWLVAMVVTSSNTTIYAINNTNLLKSTHVYPHVIQSFSGTTVIGADSGDNNTGNTAFSGVIDDVAVFGQALSQDQLVALYSAASGVSTFAPMIVTQPGWPAPPGASSPFQHQTVTATVVASGSTPLGYQWKSGPSGGPYTDVVDAGRISGAKTASLTISDLALSDSAYFVVVVSNAIGSVTSAEANLSVQASLGGPQAIQIYRKQPGGSDWDTAGWWSDGNAASYSAAAYPGSTYEAFVGLNPDGTNGAPLLRSPVNSPDSTFPGAVLTMSGNGVFVNNSGTTATISEFRFKHAVPPAFPGGRVTFPRLVMNGGQLDQGDDGIVTIAGRMDILTNAPLYNDGGNDRGYTIEAWLTGTGSIEYRGNNTATFSPLWVNPLNITGTSNTFSGPWNIVVGTLLGSAPNSLGTNDITIGTAGAFEPGYDVNNPAASFRLNGRMFLHQNCTFRSVFITNTPLAVGTYTQAQLAAAYPAFFPNTWTMQAGSTVSNANPASTITVLYTPAPQVVQQPVNVAVYAGQPAQFTATISGTPPLYFQWKKNNAPISDTANRIGSQSNVLSILIVGAGDADTYSLTATNAAGSVTTTNVTLSLLTPPTVIKMSAVQPGGNDWDTAADWDNGYSATASVALFPDVTFELLPGARSRPSINTDPAVFPGKVLRADGNGVWNDAFFTGNGNDATVSEIRMKHSNPGTVRYPRLVMAGGIIDNGDNGPVTIQGQMDIISNTIFYVTTDAGQERGYTIAAFLTGNASIEYHSWGTTYTGDLNIAGNTNTYSGTWNIVQGALLGSGLNSLGTNSITLGAAGILETLYDVKSAGTLTLNASSQVFLHQSNTFAAVIIDGTPLAQGVYSFEYLSSTYPGNFPTSWTALPGSAITSGSGQITVGPLATPPPPPVTITVTPSGANFQLIWSQGQLLEATSVTGPWTTNNAATSPFTVVPNGPQKFYRILVQ